MNYTLNLKLSAGEGTVIRALGLIERRGFRLDSCSVSEVDAGSRCMQVKVTSSRPGDLLKRQLERLHDVYHVELRPVSPGKSQPTGLHPISRRI